MGRGKRLHWEQAMHPPTVGQELVFLLGQMWACAISQAGAATSSMTGWREWPPDGQGLRKKL